MTVYLCSPRESTNTRAGLSMHGHRPQLLKGQKAAVLALLLKHRGQWVPAYKLAAIALQYSARIRELRTAGFDIDNKPERVNGKVHGSFQLVAWPGETCEVSGGR